MDHKLLVFSCLLVGMTEFAHTQGNIFAYPFELPADPRSFAMGESFVALPSDPAALMYNPAGLAELMGINVSYSHRGLNWVPPTDGWSISTINAAVATSFGVFGAQYNRKSMGTLPVTTVRFPDGDGTELSLYSHDIALGYALRLPRGPSATA